MTRAVIFDVDGTLIDSVDLHARAWVEAFRHFGLDVPFGTVRSQIGKGGDQLMPVFLSPQMLRSRGDEIAEWRANLFKRAYLDQIRPFPGVRALFQRIRDAGQVIALASSGKGDEVARYKEIAGIADLVDAETTSDDARHSKPHPDIFEAVLKRIAPRGAKDAVVVGDTPYDAEAAGKARLATIGVRSGGFPDGDLRQAGCIALYDGPQDLLLNYESSPLAPGWSAT